MVRAIAAVLYLSWVHAELAPHYSAIGRPSIDPMLMMRMLVVGYVFAIRSERARCREVQVNLCLSLVLWARIEDRIPDHSVFSRARNERFRDHHIFSSGVRARRWSVLAAGLVGGEGFAVDASVIQADANKHRSIPGAAWNKEIDPEQAGAPLKNIWRRSTILPGRCQCHYSEVRFAVRSRRPMDRRASQRGVFSPTPTTISSL